MNLFIDTSIFVDVLRKETVESSKLLFDSILEDNDGFTSSITVAELGCGCTPIIQVRFNRKDDGAFIPRFCYKFEL